MIDHGQVYTPEKTADEMMDLVCPVQVAISDPGRWWLMDPSCGDGGLLLAAVRWIHSHVPKSAHTRFYKAMVGMDIDPIALDKCRQRLVDATGWNQWDLRKCNSLLVEWPQVSYIIANPPYVRTRNMDAQTLAYLRSTHIGEKGMIDLWMGFIDKISQHPAASISIIPAAIRRNSSASRLRERLLSGGRMSLLRDHGDDRKFPDALVATCYVGLRAQTASNGPCQIRIEIGDENTTIDTKSIPWSGGDRWCPSRQDGESLGDITGIHVGIATLADSVYIVDDMGGRKNNGSLTETSSGWMETALLRQIIRASVRDSERRKALVIYPYKDGKIIPELELRKYPCVYQHLVSCRKTLDGRDKGVGNKVAWYAFGRTQGLRQRGRVVVVAPLAAPGKPPTAEIISNDSLIVGGHIFSPCDGHTCEELMSIIQSEKFVAYIEKHGSRRSGGWIAFSKADIIDYPTGN